MSLYNINIELYTKIIHIIDWVGSGFQGHLRNQSSHMKRITFLSSALLGMCSFAQLTRFYKDGKVGYRDINMILVAGYYDAGGEFSEGLALVIQGGKRGFINESGKEVIALNYADATSFHEGLAAVSNGKQYGYVNAEGKTVIPFIYEEAGVFINGLARIKKDGKYGFIDLSGEVVVNTIFDETTIFFNGYASIKQNGKWGFINTSGEILIPCIYENTRPFVNGVARVILGEEILKINENGKVLSRRPLEYGEDFERECKEMKEMIDQGRKNIKH